MRLKYGENPHQQAALYGWGGTPAGLDERAPASADSAAGIATDNTGENNAAAHPTPPSVAGARQLQGKELGFNNLLDLDAALRCRRQLQIADRCGGEAYQPLWAGV